MTPARCEPLEDWGDKSLPEDSAIQAAHPLNGGDPDRMAEAMRLVGAKRSKAALVELVNWLLAREAAAYQRGQRDRQTAVDLVLNRWAFAPDALVYHTDGAAKADGWIMALGYIRDAIAALPIKEKPE